MLDITLLRKDLDSAIRRLETRKSPQKFLDVDAFRALEAERKTLQTRTEELQNQRNTLSKKIGQFMAQKDLAAAEAAKAAASDVQIAFSAASSENRALFERSVDAARLAAADAADAAPAAAASTKL